MPSRILLIATILLALPISATAQPSAKDRIKKLQTQAPLNNEAQSPIDPALAPLASLPQLPGATWREWIIPALGIVVPGPQQKEITTTVQVINVNNTKTTAAMQCYAFSGRATFKETRALAENGMTKFPLNSGWCRISADHPVTVYIKRFSKVRMMINGSPDNQLVTLRNTEIFHAIPYPAE